MVRRRGWTAPPAAVLAPLVVLALSACSRGEAAGGAAVAAPELAVQGWTLEPAARVGGVNAGEQEQLYTVTSVAEDAQGRFFVANFGDKRILVFDSAGTYLRTIGRGGRGPGEFTAPRALAPVGEDGLLVLDLVPGRISRFRRSDGQHLADAKLPDAAGIPVDLRATAAGTTVVEFRPRPQTGVQAPAFLARVDTATGAVDRAGAVTLDTVARARVNGKTEKGKMSVTIDVPFAPRPVWAVQEDGAVLYGTGARFEVSRALGGKTETAFRGTGEPRPVTARDRDGFFSDPNAEQFRGEVVFPRTHPFYSGMFTDPDGTVWLRVAAERGERWEVRDAAGTVRGTFTLPEGSRLVHASRGSIYVLSKDDDDVETLSRYRLRR